MYMSDINVVNTKIKHIADIQKGNYRISKSSISNSSFSTGGLTQIDTQEKGAGVLLFLSGTPL